jgi:hypothetical protein
MRFFSLSLFRRRPAEPCLQSAGLDDMRDRQLDVNLIVRAQPDHQPDAQTD